MTCPVLASEGVMNGLRGESRCGKSKMNKLLQRIVFSTRGLINQED